MITTRGSPDKAVGMQLQSLRIYAGLSLENAAQRMELSVTTLAAFEAGEARPTSASVFAMAKCYAVAPSEVFAIAAAAASKLA